MDSESISDKNLHELLYYLNNVKLIDKLRILQVDVVILVIWALLALIASFSETFLNISTGSNFTIIIWIITITFGGILTLFLKEQLYLTTRPKFKLISNLLLIIIVLGILIAIIFENIVVMKEIIFPLYSVLIAIYTYNILHHYYTDHSDVFKRDLSLVIPISCLFSGFVNVSGTILEDTNPNLFNSMLNVVLIMVSHWTI